MDVKGKNVTIVGLGRTSLALVKLLLREGATPFVTERDDTPKLVEYKRALDELGVRYECGGHSAGAFERAGVIIPSPGVSPNIPPIAKAREAGAMVVGEMEFASGYCKSHVLAVTGTNGKTTTTELLRALVEACGHSVVLAGNNAFPFSSAVQLEPAPEFIVLEVSSYQLETARAFRPWIGAVLNVTPDHLARHGTMENYAAVKACMFENQEPGDFAVINVDDPMVRGMADSTRATVWRF
ncbi:MAG: Mur ligase family protein, partial [FCB group bacterium]|nr:Mur ligase family protein [FCB group bacterium]